MWHKSLLLLLLASSETAGKTKNCKFNEIFSPNDGLTFKEYGEDLSSKKKTHYSFVKHS